MKRFAHPFETRINLALTNTIVKKIEKANSSQRAVNFPDNLLTILNKSVEKMTKVNSWNFLNIFQQICKISNNVIMNGACDADVITRDSFGFLRTGLENHAMFICSAEFRLKFGYKNKEIFSLTRLVAACVDQPDTVKNVFYQYHADSNK